MKRLIAVLLISLFSLLLVAGCGKKQEQTETTTEQAPATDTAGAMTDTAQAQPGGGK